MDHPNAMRMRDTVDAFLSGDMPRLLDGFADDVVWYAPGNTQASGTFHGRDGVARFFASMNERSAGSMHIEVDDVLASDRFVTIFLKVTAARDGDALSVVIAQFAVPDDDGRWSRGWFLPDELEEWNRFFA
jgi:ketosteroid isomerase-like protein